MRENNRLAPLLIFAALAIILALGLSACTGAATETTTAEVPPTEEPAQEETATEIPTTEEPAGDGNLLILEWSGYEATEFPYFFGSFTEKYTDTLSDTLDYSFFAEDAEALAKMQTGFEADLVHPCNSWWQLYVDAGLVQPIDTSRLSNWSGVHPDLAAMGQFDGQQYFVPWDWGYESILVRTDLVEEVPDSWTDLWDPQYTEHVVLWDSAEANFMMTALSLGFDPANTTPEQDEAVKQKLLELKPNLFTYWADYTDAYGLAQEGDAWLLANVWQDAFAFVDSEGFEVEYIQPEEGRLGWVCGYGIGAGLSGADLDLAYEFLDSGIEPESMAALANTYWYGAANVDAIPLIDEYVVDFMQLDQIDTLTERTVFYQPLTEEQRQIRTSIWDEVKVGLAE
ncbi:MAG TPA: extracellular solute-binding protein [Anaerolineales bacterium]|nr:extracellular solute-binding protein [Anaerolineales bacterium]